ncbi:MAG TPA: hypothetical protein VKD72_03555 [Gemmataceae bacterium]|nr:hypothetical protein [Gemmataceae bacterium]
MSGPPISPDASQTQTIVQTGGRPDRPPAPPPEEHPVLAAWRCYRDRQPDKARDRLKDFDPSTRELLERLLPLVVSLSERKLDRIPPGELSALVRRFEALAEMLRPRAGLEITEVRFCRTIRRFGDYDPLPADHAFQAGAGDRPGDFVQVYVELRNFTCRKNGPFYETALASSLTIRDAKGALVCRLGEPLGRPAQVDRLLSRRLDCFLNCHFYVPPNLPAGEYKLVIEVKDVTGLPEGVKAHDSHVATWEVPFRIASPAYASGTWNNADAVP